MYELYVLLMVLIEEMFGIEDYILGIKHDRLLVVGLDEIDCRLLREAWEAEFQGEYDLLIDGYGQNSHSVIIARMATLPGVETLFG